MKFTEAQNALILEQGEQGTLVAKIRRKAGVSQAAHVSRKKNSDRLLFEPHRETAT